MVQDGPGPAPEELGGGIGQRIGRALEIVFPTLASAVFVVLWLYVAAAVFTDGQLLEDTWAWMTSLGIIGTVVVWIALLPIGAFLWAWQADLEPLLMGLVMIGLVAWTALAFSGLPRPFRARRPSRTD